MSKNYFSLQECKNIVIYGAGEVGELCLQICKARNVEPICFCDNNTSKHNTQLCGLDIYSFNKINESIEDPIFILAFEKYLEVIPKLVETGSNWIYFKHWLDEPFLSGTLPKHINFDIKKYENIVIFGAGFFGEKCLQILQKMNISPVAFCDNDQTKQGFEKLGLNIYSFEEIGNKFENPILIIASQNNREDMINQLRNSVYNWAHFKFWESNSFLNKNAPANNRLRLSKLQTYDNQFIYVDNVDLVITEKCSLKCRECSNLMQYYENPKNYDKQNIFSYIDQISEVFDLVNEIRIIGGEPFMHKDIYDIIEYATSKKNILCVGIWSNSTILLNENEIKKVDKSKLSFNITNYIGLSLNIDKNLMILDKYKISYACHDADMWTNCSEIEFIDRTEDELADLYNYCCVRNFVTVLDGKIFLCPYVANIYNLKALPLNELEYIDIMNYTNLDDVKERIKQFLYCKKYLNACKYCRGRDIRVQPDIPAAIQTKLPLPYKKY